MAEWTPSPEFENFLRRRLSGHEPAAGFADSLRAKILDRAAGRRPAPRPLPLAWRWALAALLLLVITVLAIGPQRVMAAIRDLFGEVYVPGVGLVSDAAPLRTIDGPVTVAGEGATLTIRQVLLSADETLIVHRVEYHPPLDVPDENIMPICIFFNRLLLPNGTVLRPTSSFGEGNIFRYTWQETFWPIPAGVEDATLVISCLPNTAPDRFPEHWKVPLHFTLLSPEVIAQSVLTVPPVPGVDDINGNSTFPLRLDKVILLEDGYIFVGSVRPIPLPDGRLPTVTGINMRIVDSEGQRIDAIYVNELTDFAEEAGTLLWGLRISGRDHPWPLTITLDKIMANLPGTAAFEFDTGPDPRPDKIWTLNRTLTIEDYTLRVLTATRLPDGYRFLFQGDLANDGLTFGVDDPLTWRTAVQVSDDGLTYDLIFDGDVPEGILTMVIYSARVSIPGPWSIQWMPIGQRTKKDSR